MAPTSPARGNPGEAHRRLGITTDQARSTLFGVGGQSDPETSPEERAIATDIKEDISRRARLLTDDVKEGTSGNWLLMGELRQRFAKKFGYGLLSLSTN